MPVSLRDYWDFVEVWIKKRTGVHLGEVVIYPAMVRHCLCCQKGHSYARKTNGLCEVCAAAPPTCSMCKQVFEPDDDSVGPYCQTCWAKLETTWTETFQNEDPVRAVDKTKALVIAAKPPLLGCRHGS